MLSKDAIEHAIGTHALWRDHLKAAFVSGLPMASPESVWLPDRCEFGAWLLGPDLSPEEKASKRYRTVDRLHAEFHEAASELVGLALAGRKPEAAASMAPGGAFDRASARLLSAMKAWHDILD